MKDGQRIAVGAVLIVLQGVVLGFAANAVNPNRLPWIRVPLRETHRMADSRDVLSPRPAPKIAENTKGVGVVPPQPVETTPTPPAQPSVAMKPGPALVKPIAAKPSPIPKTAPQPQVKAPAKTGKSEALFTTLSDAKVLFDKKSAVFVDARHKEDYDAEHIRGALSLFADEIDKRFDVVMSGIPKDETIVTYCSDPQCDASIRLADALVARGYKHVFILLEGLPGWKGGGYPTTTGGNP